MESTGPDAKVRGPAAHIYERYLQLARDAASSGDRLLSENYLQHADHYFRLVRQMQPAAPPPQPERFTGEGEFGGEDEGAPEAEEGETAAAEGSDQPEVEFPQGQQPQQFERGEGEGRRRRGRRNRFRPGGGEGEGGGEGDERRAEGEGPRERGDWEGREGRRDRPREREGEREQAGPEGFSNGPRPAFLRGGD
jgi:hypothetical protein